MNESVNNNENMVEKKKGITIFCHFSFKRPKGKSYGLFAVAFYSDFIGKKLITQKTRKFDLWEDHQFITGIQAYEHALLTIYELQGMMVEAGIRQVMLVTDNTTLAGWIEKPNKNKNYAPYMQKAVKSYRVGEPKEIVIGIGLCEPRKSEKSYKYCTEEKVSNVYVPKAANQAAPSGYKIQIGEYKSALDIIDSDINIPEIGGISDVEV